MTLLIEPKAEPEELKWGDLCRNEVDGTVQKYFCPHQAQLDILNNTEARILLALGGWNSGKTAIGMLWLCNEIIKHKFKGHYLIIATTYSVVLSSTLERWIETVRDWEPFWNPKGWHPHQTNPRYQMPNGTNIYFRSADGTLDGLKPNAIIADEFGGASLEQFSQVKGRLAQGGRLLITTTPYSTQDWLKHEIMEKADSGNSFFFYREMRSDLNPKTDKEVMEQERLSLEPWLWEMKYLGKYTRPASIVYNFDDCYVSVEDLPKDKDGDPMIPAGQHIGGLDFGGENPTGGLLAVRDTNDVLWIYWEYYKARGTTDVVQFCKDIAEWNTTFKAKIGKTPVWFADPAGKSIIRSLRTANVFVRKADKRPGQHESSITLGISLVNARVRTKRLKIISGQCPNLRKESLRYRYPTADGLPYGTVPLKKDDDLMDALRYLVMGIDRKAAHHT
jgi:hypothetical protein